MKHRMVGRMIGATEMVLTTLDWRQVSGILGGLGLIILWTSEGHVHVTCTGIGVPASITSAVCVKRVALGDTMALFLDANGLVLHWDLTSTAVGPLFGQHDQVNRVCMDIAVGLDHALILAASPRVVLSFGANQYGQCGVGRATQERMPLQEVMGCDIASFTAVACGALHSCAIASNGELYVWGSNREGQLGPLENTNELLVVVAPTVQQHEIGGLWVSSVSCGLHHTAGLLRSTRRAFGFGSNQSGALGTMIKEGCAPFFHLPHIEEVISVQCGHRHTAILGANGAISVTGWPQEYQSSANERYSKVFASHWFSLGVIVDEL